VDAAHAGRVGTSRVGANSTNSAGGHGLGRRGRGRGSRSWRCDDGVKRRQDILHVGGKSLVPRRWVSGSKRGSHLSSESGGRGERIADGILGQRSREDHENRLLELSTVQPILVMEFDCVACDQRRRAKRTEWEPEPPRRPRAQGAHRHC
jgi:hypothetical protein